MRRPLTGLSILVFVILVFTGITHASDTNTPLETESRYKDFDVIAFVGRKISFEENTIPEIVSITLPDGRTVEKVVPSFDTRYEAKYEVIEPVYGKISEPIIEFEVYDHYGRPGLPNIKTPLVLLVRHDDRWIQSKYNNYALTKTKDNDWAVCGPPARLKSSKDQGHRFTEYLQFVDPVKDENGLICSVGTRAKNIFNYQNETRFIPNGERSNSLSNR